jgi:hypothetical protein
VRYSEAPVDGIVRYVHQFTPLSTNNFSGLGYQAGLRQRALTQHDREAKPLVSEWAPRHNVEAVIFALWLGTTWIYLHFEFTP